MNFRNYPWWMLASTYITQYIGLAFIMSAAMAILRQRGMSLDKLALVNLAVLPLAGKVLYAPIIDKYRLSSQGTYRSWLLVAQSSMVFLLFVAGTLDFEQQFPFVLGVLALYVFAVSIQDVAVDGLSCKLFDAESRKFANSVQFSGNLLGNIIGGGLILTFYPSLLWRGSLWLLAGLTCISLLQILLYREPEENSSHSGNTPQSTTLWLDIKLFLSQQKRWFLIMALYPIGSTCGFALLNPLLVDSGWQLDKIGFVLKIYGSVVGLLSALFAAPLIGCMGRINALISVVLLQAFALLLVIPIALGYTTELWVYAAVTVHFLAFPALLVVTSTIIMDKAALTNRKATFFTLQFSFASMLGFAYSAASLALAKHVGYSTVVIAGTVFTAGVAVLVWLMREQTTAIDTLDTFGLQEHS